MNGDGLEPRHLQYNAKVNTFLKVKTKKESRGTQKPRCEQIFVNDCQRTACPSSLQAGARGQHRQTDNAAIAAAWIMPFCYGPLRAPRTIGFCKQQKLLGGSLALSCKRRTRAREMRVQDAAVETTSLQQSMVCHVFSELLAGCVRQRGVSQALVRRASLRANMHVHFVFWTPGVAAAAFFLPRHVMSGAPLAFKEPTFWLAPSYLLAMFLEYKVVQRGRRPARAARAPRAPFHVMLSASRAARTQLARREQACLILPALENSHG